MCCKFLWKNSNDKIKRNITTQEYKTWWAKDDRGKNIYVKFETYLVKKTHDCNFK